MIYMWFYKKVSSFYLCKIGHYNFILSKNKKNNIKKFYIV